MSILRSSTLWMHKKEFDDVVRKLNDPRVFVRIESIKILEQLEPAAFARHATSILKKELRDTYEVQKAASCALRTFGNKLYNMMNDPSTISRHRALRVLRDAGVGGFHVLIWNNQLSSRYEHIRMELLKNDIARIRKSYTTNPQLGRWFVCAAQRNFEQQEERWIASMETAMVDLMCGDDYS